MSVILLPPEDKHRTETLPKETTQENASGIGGTPTVMSVHQGRTNVEHGEGSGFAECLQICHEILDSQGDPQAMQKLQPLVRNSVLSDSSVSQVGHEQGRKENIGHQPRRSNCMQGRRGARWSSRMARQEYVAEKDLPKAFMLSGAQLLPEKIETSETKTDINGKLGSTVDEKPLVKDPLVEPLLRNGSSPHKPCRLVGSEFGEFIVPQGGTAYRVKNISFPGIDHIRLEPDHQASFPLNLDSVDDILRQHRKAMIDTNVDRDYTTNLRRAQASGTLLHDSHKDFGLTKNKGSAPERKRSNNIVEDTRDWDTLSLVGSRVRG